MKFGTTMHISPPKLMGYQKICKSKIADSADIENRKIVIRNRLVNFDEICTMTQLASRTYQLAKKSFLKIQDSRRLPS